MTVAQGLASGLGARVVVLSDAPVDVDAERFPNKPHQRVLARGSRPGQGDDNVGISGLHTRARADRTRDDEREVTVAVATSSAKARRVRLSMRQEGNVLADREVTIPPRGESTERVTVRSGGKIFAEVSALDGTADAVSLDDRASLEQPIVSPPRVALVSPIATTSEDATSTFFVEHAVRASGVAELVRVDPQGESLPDAGSVAFDVAVVVVDGPGRPRDVPSFYVGAPPAQLTNVHVATRETARLRSVANDDALIRGVALDEVTFLRANVATPSPGSRVIVDLDAGPTLIAGGSGAQSWVWLGIEPQASDLVLRVAFPVLIGNVLAHLSGGAQTLAAQTVPRSEITFTAREVSVPLADAPEPRWRLPTSLPMVLAMVAALLLAFEAWWTFRSASRAP